MTWKATAKKTINYKVLLIYAICLKIRCINVATRKKISLEHLMCQFLYKHKHSFLYTVFELFNNFFLFQSKYFVNRKLQYKIGHWYSYPLLIFGYVLASKFQNGTWLNWVKLIRWLGKLKQRSTINYKVWCENQLNIVT